MRKYSFLIITILFCFNDIFSAEKILTYTFEEFKENILVNHNSDELLVINFWATWCGPCVRELPYFEEANTKFKDDNVRIILVSLDFEKQYEEKLLPFIKEKGLNSELIWLNDTKYNDWIDQVTPEWSGAIPATVFMKNGEVLAFHEAELSKEELELIINKLL
jgi:thiol-disulfide isomerase/thioredoxin